MHTRSYTDGKEWLYVDFTAYYLCTCASFADIFTVVIPNVIHFAVVDYSQSHGDLNRFMLDGSAACRIAHCADLYFFFFFFQAEDGIRDLIVTGVQTCALPI